MLLFSFQESLVNNIKVLAVFQEFHEYSVFVLVAYFKLIQAWRRMARDRARA